MRLIYLRRDEPLADGSHLQDVQYSPAPDTLVCRERVTGPDNVVRFQHASYTEGDPCALAATCAGPDNDFPPAA